MRREREGETNSTMLMNADDDDLHMKVYVNKRKSLDLIELKMSAKMLTAEEKNVVSTAVLSLLICLNQLQLIYKTNRPKAEKVTPYWLRVA